MTGPGTTPAQAGVDWWSAVYTRGLPHEVASERREELAADVQDQIAWGRERGAGARDIERAVTRRAIKGVPADLAWRRAQLRAADPTGFPTRIFDGWLLAGMRLLGVVLLGVSAISVLRDWRLMAQGDPLVMPVCVAAAVIACGLALLGRDRTRSLGALWIAAAAPVVCTVGITLLAQNTTLLLSVSDTSLWIAGQVVAAIGVTVFALAASAWWLPERTTRAAR